MLSIFTFAKDIKISHSIFALPFVGVGILLSPIDQIYFSDIALIVASMICARSFSMGVNRIVDEKFDLKNPRTSARAIPSGRATPDEFWGWTILFGCCFVGLAFQLSKLAGACSIPTLLILGGYSFMKRISWLTHWYLGMCLGLAPIAAEVALVGVVSYPVLLLGISVMFWTAGFDLLYSLQDRKFDVENNLKSVPANFGHKTALLLSIVSFVFMTGCLVLAGYLKGTGILYSLGLVATVLILAIEHWLVREAWTTGTSQNIGPAFFNYNAILSVSFFVFALLDRILFNANQT
jgi:4-hydroxybenzoate polyprenyltransferase